MTDSEIEENDLFVLTRSEFVIYQIALMAIVTLLTVLVVRGAKSYVTEFYG